MEPAGALNVGAIARVMKNMGLQHLVLVQPRCDILGDEARLMAVHAAEVLETAQIVATLPGALQGCQRAIATTGRPRTSAFALEAPRTALPWLLDGLDVKTHSALIFGREDRGLTTEELNYAQRFIYIPSHPDYPSLNLAQAVGICCYELFQLVMIAPEVSPPAELETLASLDSLENYYQHLEALLLAIGYVYPHTAASRMQKIRRLLNRALPLDTELALLRGILRQMQWALQQSERLPIAETKWDKPSNHL